MRLALVLLLTLSLAQCTAKREVPQAKTASVHAIDTPTAHVEMAQVATQNGSYTFNLLWRLPVPGRYVCERQQGASWVPVDTFTTPMDTIPAVLGTVERYKGRALLGTRRSERTATLLYLDWSMGGDTPYPLYSAIQYQSDSSFAAVKVLLPCRAWTMVYGFTAGEPTYVKATCDYDYDRNGVVNISDFVTFSIWYKTHHDVVAFAELAESYNKTGLKVWP
jgi:hypothetical protein